MKNRLGIVYDPETLRSAGRMLIAQRAETVGDIRGNFDQQHLRDIHQHLFQDVYVSSISAIPLDFMRRASATLMTAASMASADPVA